MIIIGLYIIIMIILQIKNEFPLQYWYNVLWTWKCFSFVVDSIDKTRRIFESTQTSFQHELPLINSNVSQTKQNKTKRIETSRTQPSCTAIWILMMHSFVWATLHFKCRNSLSSSPMFIAKMRANKHWIDDIEKQKDCNHNYMAASWAIAMFWTEYKVAWIVWSGSLVWLKLLTYWICKSVRMISET